MEDVLDLYAEPDDPLHPVVCLDECPYQFLDDVMAPAPPCLGRSARYDYEYRRMGLGSLFVPFCRARGWRHVIVCEHYDKLDCAHALQWLIDEQFPAAESIRLIVDNLNTHSPASLYAAFPPTEAKRIADKLEIHPTPKHGSWLNMAGVETAVLSTQCLDRRIPDLETLTAEVAIWEDKRTRTATTIDWRFTTDDARIKLKRLYPVTA